MLGTPVVIYMYPTSIQFNYYNYDHNLVQNGAAVQKTRYKTYPSRVGFGGRQVVGMKSPILIVEMIKL